MPLFHYSRKRLERRLYQPAAVAQAVSRHGIAAPKSKEWGALCFLAKAQAMFQEVVEKRGCGHE